MRCSSMDGLVSSLVDLVERIDKSGCLVYNNSLILLFSLKKAPTHDHPTLPAGTASRCLSSAPAPGSCSCLCSSPAAPTPALLLSAQTFGRSTQKDGSNPIGTLHRRSTNPAPTGSRRIFVGRQNTRHVLHFNAGGRRRNLRLVDQWHTPCAGADSNGQPADVYDRPLSRGLPLCPRKAGLL